MASDLNTLKELVKTIDYDIYKGIFVNPDYPDEAKAEIKNLLSILKQKPKVTLNKNFNKFVKLVKKVWNGDDDLKIRKEAYDKLSADLFDVILELLYERKLDLVFKRKNNKTEKEFIMHALKTKSYCFVDEFVKDIEL